MADDKKENDVSLDKSLIDTVSKVFLLEKRNTIFLLQHYSSQGKRQENIISILCEHFIICNSMQQTLKVLLDSAVKEKIKLKQWEFASLKTTAATYGRTKNRLRKYNISTELH